MEKIRFWNRIRDSEFTDPDHGGQLITDHQDPDQQHCKGLIEKLIICTQHTLQLATVAPILKLSIFENHRHIGVGAIYAIGYQTFSFLKYSVADPDPGSGAFLTPGSGIRNRFFPDPGSQTHVFEGLVTIFW